MTNLTRRSFVVSVAAIPFSAWLKSIGADVQKPRTRYDARSEKGQEMLKSYALAVGRMKKKADSEPLSWVFQWYSHWVNGSTTKQAELTRIYPTGGANQQLAVAMWNMCQAHGPNENEDNFLLWHRAFVYYFESIIRAVSEKPEFTLPYWNYSTTDTTIRGVIPPEFTKSNDPLFESLYVANRNPGVNQGEPIQKGQPGDPLSTAVLDECSYEPQGSQGGFCMDLDSGLHGNVHVLVGNSQNMGSVPWAAEDPIFWMHHCNIDRLWASWSAAGRTTPAIQQAFVFVDEKGQKVTANLKDYVAIAPLGYDYDHLEKVPPCLKTTAALVAAAKAQTRAAAVKATPIKLSAEPVRVTLEATPEVPGGR